MALIVTFLGKGGTGRTTTAIAIAKKLAILGSRVLLAGQDPTLEWLWSVPLTASVTVIEPNLSGVHLCSTVLLEQGWEQIKGLESQYLRSPTLKNIYGQELGVLPGMDELLVLNALREYAKGGQYDVIIYDGFGQLNALRMLGVPEIADWYWRRFRQVLQDSDVVRTLAPFIQPITGALFNNVTSNGDNSSQSSSSPEKFLTDGKQFLNDPSRFAAYLVTNSQPAAVMVAQRLWGGAQQVGLTVKGVLQTPGGSVTDLTSTFQPLTITSLPQQSGQSWDNLIAAVPDVRQWADVPKPLTIDLAARQVKVFLPGFDKKQVKLIQSGPEITIEAGDQRRNIDLPVPLNGQPVTGAKFHEGYLIISF